MHRKLVLLGFMLIVVCESAEVSKDKSEFTNRSNKFSSDLKYLYNTYKECSSSDMAHCLKLKLIESVDRVARFKNDIHLIDGVSFVRDEGVKDEKEITIDEIENALPRSFAESEKALNDLVLEKIMGFFRSHTLQIKLSTPSASEARGQGGYGGLGGNKGGFGGNKNKDKKNGHWIMIPLLLGSTLVPLAFGALALLAGKALIVSKLALALASIIGIKKLISGSGHHHEAAHEVVVSGGHGSGWGRIGNFGGQSLAYNAYNP